MDFTCIHIFGHLLSEDIIKAIESDNNLAGNRDRDFGIEGNTVKKEVDYVWSGVRRDWEYCMKDRNFTNDPYGTKSVRKFMRSFLTSLGYNIEEQRTNIQVGAKSFNITALCPDCEDLPIIIEGDRINESAGLTTTDKCSLDYRAKGDRQQKSPHARMLEYLNATENIYGIVSNGKVIRVIRNSGQLVKLTYMEFDLEKIIEEDHYAEFVILFRLLHASRFVKHGEDSVIFEQYFNQSIESGNRIRAGLSKAVENSMRAIGSSAFNSNGFLKEAYINGELKSSVLHKELIHLIYKLLFLFIIEDRHLIYDENLSEEEANKIDIYRRFYSAGRFRNLSEYKDAKKSEYHDLWESLFETFKLFEDEEFGSKLGIKPLGGELFAKDSTPWLRKCKIDNKTLLQAFTSLNEFQDEASNWVKINYTALDVEEFGSVYEGILELEAYVTPGTAHSPWIFDYKNGGDRKSTSSYYTRPDLVNNLVKSTLVPVIEEKLKACSTQIEKEKMLLSLKVCDAASGSGHIVLAMARTIAWYLSVVRSGEDNPASKDYREALREVIQKCVYAVDYNPDAVELCKIVLWIEGYCTGKPLSFLDHQIRCGNSVVGVSDLDVLLKGVPNDAFSAEDKETLKIVKTINSDALSSIKSLQVDKQSGVQLEMFSDDFVIGRIDREQVGLADQIREISSLPEESLLEEITKQKKWEDLMQSPRVECLRRACDIYTYSYYKFFSLKDVKETFDGVKFSMPPIPYTKTLYHALEEIKHLEEDNSTFIPLSDGFKKEVSSFSQNNRFFHWCIEFPEVFVNNGGFDVMCGNPPWDKIKIEEKKWFESKGALSIVNAGSGAQRKKAISDLEASNPELYNEYILALQSAYSQSVFLRTSGRFPLTAVGDIDLYPLFAEMYLSFSKDAWGLVIPTAIATNDSTKDFFGKLIEENRLISLYDFENKEALFDIHRMFKFCLLTAGKPSNVSRSVKGGFYLTKVEHIVDTNRVYSLKTSDFTFLNPNTKTCPVFRTTKDANLTIKMCKHASVLINDADGNNPWSIRMSNMFHMTNDSDKFNTYQQLIDKGLIKEGNNFYDGPECYVPLYEGKMIWLYNHHFGAFPQSGNRPNAISEVDIKHVTTPSFLQAPWYWVNEKNVLDKLIKQDSDNNIIWQWEHHWAIGMRNITNGTNERTCVVSFIPLNNGVGDTLTLLFCGLQPTKSMLLVANMNALTFDYICRPKVPGTHINNFIAKQFFALSPDFIINSGYADEIISRVYELCFFNDDMMDWANEMWDDMSVKQRELTNNRWQCINNQRIESCHTLKVVGPFKYDCERRRIAQAEIDAIFAHLYNLSTDELRYILDPEDICGVGCINETFRVLKDREMREHGEYRTKRLVLDAWHRFGFDK